MEINPGWQANISFIFPYPLLSGAHWGESFLRESCDTVNWSQRTAEPQQTIMRNKHQQHPLVSNEDQAGGWRGRRAITAAFPNTCHKARVDSELGTSRAYLAQLCAIFQAQNRDPYAVSTPFITNVELWTSPRKHSFGVQLLQVTFFFS